MIICFLCISFIFQYLHEGAREVILMLNMYSFMRQRLLLLALRSIFVIQLYEAEVTPLALRGQSTAL